MAGPIENIAARGVGGAGGAGGASGTDWAEGGKGKVSGKFDQARQAQQAQGTEGTAPVSEAGEAAATRRIEHDLRKRLETAKTTDPRKLYGQDIGEARKRIDQMQKKVASIGNAQEASPLRDRLAQIEAQFTASEKRLGQMPETDNLRDLLTMQTEMYKLGQNIEILSKVVDAATSGIKSTLQMQV